MKAHHFAIVDVETTGCSHESDRIIEVGVFVVENGRVVERFSSLVNPERPVPPFVLRLTGIREAELARAPVFSAIERDLHALLKDRLFVAHNARFDYGFLQSEFQRAGRKFAADSLCTVRLSRRLFPTERRHGVDELIGRFGFSIASRHRALDDAEILWKFLQTASERFSEERVGLLMGQLVQKAQEEKTGAAVGKLLRTLPRKSGVYILYNDVGTPLYVGQAEKIRDRVRAHFANRSAVAQKICRQIADVHAIPTASPLESVLLEAYLIRTLLPSYNQRSRRTRHVTLVRANRKIESAASIGASEMEDVLGVFRSYGQAKRFLEASEEGHSSRIRPWPFPGPVLIQDGFLVDHWCLLGMISKTPLSNGLYVFDETVYRQLSSALLGNKKAYKIQSLLRSGPAANSPKISFGEFEKTLDF